MNNNKLIKDEEWLEDFFYNRFKTEKVNIDDFIKNHNYTCYCESIIFEDGRIAYVKPSHTETLLREVSEITKMSRDEIYNKIDIWDSPLEWAQEFTGAIAVWFEGFKLPRNRVLTEEQVISLKKLLNAGLTKNNNSFNS